MTAEAVGLLDAFLASLASAGEAAKAHRAAVVIRNFANRIGTPQFGDSLMVGPRASVQLLVLDSVLQKLGTDADCARCEHGLEEKDAEARTDREHRGHEQPGDLRAHVRPDEVRGEQ